MIQKEEPKKRKYKFQLLKNIIPNASKSSQVLIKPKQIEGQDQIEGIEELGGEEDKLAKMSNSYVLGTVTIYEIDS